MRAELEVMCLDFLVGEHELMTLLHESADLQQLVDHAEAVLGTPIALFDAFWNEPVRSKSYPQEDMQEKERVQGNLSEERYRWVMRQVNAQIMNKEPYIINWPIIKRERLFCGCFAQTA